MGCCWCNDLCHIDARMWLLEVWLVVTVLRTEDNFITTRRYASALYSVALFLFGHLSVTRWYYIEIAECVINAS